MTPHATLSLVMLAACGGGGNGPAGATLAGDRGTTRTPIVALIGLTDGQVVPREYEWTLNAEVSTPGAHLADLLWVSSREGVLDGVVQWTQTTAMLTLAQPLSTGDHTLTVWAITSQDRAGSARVRVSVSDNDIDGDADVATQFGGGDCDDTDPSVFTWAIDDCDGVDSDCDGAVDDDGQWESWYRDEDGDGYGADTEPVSSCSPVAGHVTNHSDCDDADATRRRCRSCAQAQAQGRITQDAPTPIEPIGGSPFNVTCDPSAHGGGWTLVATNAWDGAWAGGWGTALVMDDVPLGRGLSLAESTKSRAFSEVPFTDVLFENGHQYARYDGIGDGTRAWQRFSAGVPSPSCGTAGPWTWPATDSTLSSDGLCDTQLTLHPIQRPSSAECDRDDWADAGFGPTWSVALDGGCPLDRPHSTGFHSNETGHNPWGSETPLHMWVR